MLNYFLKLINCNKRRTTQGGGVAAPIASQVLTDVLGYMELKKDNEQEEIQEVIVPEIREMTIKDAEKTLKENGLEIEIEKEEGQEFNKDTNKVEEQLPFPGIKVKTGSKINVRIEV